MTTNDIHAHVFRVSSSLCTTSIKMTSYEWFAELGASVLLNIYASKKKILSFFLVHYALHILILKHMHILPIHTHVTPLSPHSKGNKTCFHTFHYHQCRGALSPLKHYAFSSTPYSTFRRVSSNSSTRESNINILQSLTK